jgi:hypothetical protein
MIDDVGKTNAIIRLNDFVVNMFNGTVTDGMATGITILAEDGATPRYTMAVNSDGVNSRCLMYTRSFTGDSIDHVKRPVLYQPVDDSGVYGAVCIPLYECISPGAARLMNGNYQLTWWTNMDEVPKKDESGRYVFDYSKVHKFHINELGDVESTSSSCKLLCTAPVHWEKLLMRGYDDMPYMTPIIREVAILVAVSGEGYVVDFSTGSGGGGLKIHSHLNTMEGGFAAAVFMPSAVPRQISWI